MESQIEEIELTIKQAKESVDLMDSLDRLLKNKDFKKIIEEGYFEKEASRLVLLRADPSLQEDKDQREINNRITSIGYLRQYLTGIFQLGRMAEKSIIDSEAEKEELISQSAE